MFKILIVEDNIVIIDFLKKIILIQHPDWIIDSVLSYSEALVTAQNGNYNLFILDYELNKDNLSENGFNLGIALKNIDKYQNTPVIFETSYPDHIFDAVNHLNCIYYLLKPYSDTDVNIMINKILSNHTDKKNFLVQDSQGINTYVNEADIISVKSDKHKIFINTTADTLVCTNYSLSQIIELSSILVQCHKSYAVNVTHIKHVDKTANLISLFSQANFIIPLGRKYRDNFFKKAGIK